MVVIFIFSLLAFAFSTGGWPVRQKQEQLRAAMNMMVAYLREAKMAAIEKDQNYVMALSGNQYTIFADPDGDGVYTLNTTPAHLILKQVDVGVTNPGVSINATNFGANAVLWFNPALMGFPGVNQHPSRGVSNTQPYFPNNNCGANGAPAACAAVAGCAWMSSGAGGQCIPGYRITLGNSLGTTANIIVSYAGMIDVTPCGAASNCMDMTYRP